MKGRLNTDFQWTPLPDKVSTIQDLRWEEYVGAPAARNYHKLRESFENDKFTEKDLEGSQWNGEVGRMVFSRARNSLREFMWTLHNLPGEICFQKVSCHDVP
jgi:hypothetical protein